MINQGLTHAERSGESSSPDYRWKLTNISRPSFQYGNALYGKAQSNFLLVLFVARKGYDHRIKDDRMEK